MTIENGIPEDGYSWQPSSKRPYFVFDPEGDGHTYYATEKERDEAAEAIIQDYAQNDEWSESVTQIIAGVITHNIQKTNQVPRPPDDELDEDGMDESGHYWGSVDEYCNYELSRIDLSSEDS